MSNSGQRYRCITWKWPSKYYFKNKQQHGGNNINYRRCVCKSRDYMRRPHLVMHAGPGEFGQASLVIGSL
ncbi:UNVERIFIED_CONTAM: hypothetical protein FKN15_027249 [Acipenser sinensis]